MERESAHKEEERARHNEKAQTKLLVLEGDINIEEDPNDESIEALWLAVVTDEAMDMFMLVDVLEVVETLADFL